MSLLSSLHQKMPLKVVERHPSARDKQKMITTSSNDKATASSSKEGGQHKPLDELICRHGRQKEVQLLRSCLDRLLEEDLDVESGDGAAISGEYDAAAGTTEVEELASDEVDSSKKDGTDEGATKGDKDEHEHDGSDQEKGDSNSKSSSEDVPDKGNNDDENTDSTKEQSAKSPQDQIKTSTNLNPLPIKRQPLTREQRLQRLRQRRERRTRSKRRRRRHYVYTQNMNDVTLTIDPVPLKRECVLIYGQQCMPLVESALGEYVGKRFHGWFVRGDFESDCHVFGGSGSRGGRRKSERKLNAKDKVTDGNTAAAAAVKRKIGVRFEDELCNEDEPSLGGEGIPFSGITSVVRQICIKLLAMQAESSAADSPNAVPNNDDSKAEGTVPQRRGGVRFNMSHLFDATSGELMQALSVEEQKMLVSVTGLTELACIFGLDAQDEALHEQSNQNILQYRNKLHHAFQKLISVICQSHGPLVICFNNMQLVDNASLDLLDALLLDRENSKLMVVGCIQTPPLAKNNDFSDTSPTPESLRKALKAKIDRWRVHGDLFGLTLTEIAVGNLTVDEIKTILLDSLSMENKGMDSLADVCFEETKGDVFYLTRFVEMLHKKKLIRQNSKAQWTWDAAKIASKTSESPIEDLVLRESISKLSKQARSLLLLASCLGSTTITEKLLYLVWDKFEYKSHLNHGDITKYRLLINEVLNRGAFIVVESEYSSQKAYRWAHEAILKEIIVNVAPADLAALRYEIGSTITNSMNGAQAECSIFVVANLANSGGHSVLGSLDASRRVHWAEKNLIAAKKAVELTAFNDAIRYAEAGIEYLPSNKRWSDYRPLMLDLSSVLAEVAGSLGKEVLSLFVFW